MGKVDVSLDAGRRVNIIVDQIPAGSTQLSEGVQANLLAAVCLVLEEVARAGLINEGPSWVSIFTSPEIKREVVVRKETLLTAKEAAEYLRVSMFTLSKIEREGDLVPYRTPGGHRRYSLKMLNEYLEKSRQQRKEG